MDLINGLINDRQLDCVTNLAAALIHELIKKSTNRKFPFLGSLLTYQWLNKLLEIANTNK
jgi:hypothetical protein